MTNLMNADTLPYTSHLISAWLRAHCHPEQRYSGAVALLVPQYPNCSKDWAAGARRVSGNQWVGTRRDIKRHVFTRRRGILLDRYKSFELSIIRIHVYAITTQLTFLGILIVYWLVCFLLRQSHKWKRRYLTCFHKASFLLEFKHLFALQLCRTHK